MLNLVSAMFSLCFVLIIMLALMDLIIVLYSYVRNKAIRKIKKTIKGKHKKEEKMIVDFHKCTYQPSSACLGCSFMESCIVGKEYSEKVINDV